MAAEDTIRSFVRRLLTSSSIKQGSKAKEASGEHKNPAGSCSEHPPGSNLRSLGGPEYSRLSAHALRELETDVERGIGHDSSPKAQSDGDGALKTGHVDIPLIKVNPKPKKNSKIMDLARRVSPGLSRGIIPLASAGKSSPPTVFPKTGSSAGPPFAAASKSPTGVTPHYSHFTRKREFTNGGVVQAVGRESADGGVANATGRVAEMERYSSQVEKDKERLERLAASQGAGPSGREEVPQAGTDFISVTTFNILAPIYKRVSVEGLRESTDEARWKKRNEEIVQLLLAKGSSVICLQEFWHKNEELCNLYQSRLGAAGYTMFQMGRTNDKGDGLFTAIKSNHLRVLDVREIVFHDCGDRVAQLFHLQATELLQQCSIEDHETRPFDWCGTPHAAELILVNTHLMFPHNGNACVIRLRQVYKLVDYLGRYQRERNLPPMPILLCGDWNGSKHGQVYKFLRSRGCISAYDAVHEYDDSDTSRWVSHQNHRGNLAGVDFIYLLNPSNQCEKLEADWKHGAFAMIRSKLREVGLHDRDAFQFFLKDGTHDDHITMDEFYSALDDLGLTGNEDNYGLTPEEIQEIARGLDKDGDGVISFEEAVDRVNEIEAVMEASMTVDGDSSLMMEVSSPRGPPGETTLPPEGLEFIVRDASFERADFEQAKWPSDYDLSDHAPLTAIFEPVMRVQE